MSKSTKKSSGTKPSAKQAKREKKPMADHQTAAAAAALVDAGHAMDTPAVESDLVPLTEVMKKPSKPAKTPKAEKPAKTSKTEKPDRKPSGLDAAAKVLADKGEPMRCGDIVEIMINTGLWQTSGKTPAATIYAAILREIQTKGADARFKKTDRGLFTLNAK